MLNNNPEIVITEKNIKSSEQELNIKYKKTKFKGKRYYQTVTPVKFYKLYNSGYSHKKYSALDVMDSFDAIRQGRKPVISPKEFEGKIVLIGANVPTGTGMNDIKNTPVSINHPGVDIQATAVENILYNDFVKVFPSVLNLFLTLFGMLLVYTYIRFSSLYKSIISTVTIVLGYLLFGVICYYFGVVINVLTPIVMFVLTTILAYTHKFVIENRSKEKVKSAMGKFMSQIMALLF